MFYKIRTFFILSIITILVFFCVPQNAQAKHVSVSKDDTNWLDENVVNKVTFAPELDYPPMIWSEYGVIFGISYDYLNYIEQEIGVNFPLKDPRSLNKIIESEKAGEKSVISSLTETPQRLEYLLFTRPYISVPAIFVSKDIKKITSQEIIDRKLTVAIGDGYGVHDYLKTKYPDMKLIPVNNDYLVLDAINNDKADIGVLDVASLMYLTQKHKIQELRKVSDTGFYYHLSFAVPKDMPRLRNILDHAIELIPDKFHESMLDKWGINDLSMSYLNPSNEIIIPSKSFMSENLIMGAIIILSINLIVVIHLMAKKKKEEPVE